MTSNNLMNVLCEMAEDLGFADVATTKFWPKHIQNPEQGWAGLSATIVLAMPYKYFMPPPEGAGEISAYYPTSHLAYTRVGKIAQWLRDYGYAAFESGRIPLKLNAKAAGLGSPGRNTLLQTRNCGSAVVLQAIVTDAPIPIDCADKPTPPVMNQVCGKCVICVKACPVAALPGDASLTRSKCLRNHMMIGSVVPHELRPFMGTRLCGCDICGVSCPANSPERQPFPEDLAEILNIRALLSDDSNAMAQRMLRLGELVGGNMANATRVRSQAALAAASVEGDGIREALLPLLSSEHAPTRAHAAYSLVRHGEVEAVKRAILAEQDFAIRQDMETSVETQSGSRGSK